ncbi:RNA-dependent RNA polymerase [Alternaria alternata polymycovirus 1]|nr:RNA-dependent RNA polymerase [Alternaria alternata polymycovirus 1]
MSEFPSQSLSNPIFSAAVPASPPSNADLLSSLSDVLSYATSSCLRAGLMRATHTFYVSLPGETQPVPVVVNDVSAGREPYVAVQHARASAFRLSGRNDRERLAELRAFDEEKPKTTGRKVPFYRSSARLDGLVDAASKLKSPSVVISQYQLPKAFSFGGGPPPPDKSLIAPLLGAIDAMAPVVGDPAYRAAMEDAVELGDYTTHDPDTLHPRFLNYVKERITHVDPHTAATMDAACLTQRLLWKKLGVTATPRTLSEAAPDKLLPILNSGSPGEYRACGVTDRRDSRLVDVMSQSLIRYGRVGRLVAAGKRAPAWVDNTVQPTLTFGKEEPKAAKRLADGSIEPPVPRFIFNLSPINYALCAFLHSDISHSLQRHDPTHGPGFGPGRGRSGKYMNIVKDAFGDGFTVPDDERMIMSDIDKWDASMREVLIEYACDNMEAAVDKTGLDPPSLATRAAMYKVCKRQLLRKLVEHPSGFLVDTYGTMASGSYHTSVTNTNANNLLAIGHIIDRVITETHFTRDYVARELVDLLPNRLASYGDNQLFSEKLLKHFGLRYDVLKHAEFLARFGMKLKVSETEVSKTIDRVRYCSRAVVQTPAGPLITRTHTSLASKLAARPDHDPLTDKLYLRAIMADHMGTDPVAYEMLAQMDRQLEVSVDVASVSPKTKPVLASCAKSMFGTDEQWALEAVLAGLSTTRIERRALLSLHTPRGDNTKREMKVGSTLSPVELFGGPLTPAAEWALAQTPATWIKYLKDTKQMGLLTE